MKLRQLARSLPASIPARECKAYTAFSVGRTHCTTDALIIVTPVCVRQRSSIVGGIPTHPLSKSHCGGTSSDHSEFIPTYNITISSDKIEHTILGGERGGSPESAVVVNESP